LPFFERTTFKLEGDAGDIPLMKPVKGAGKLAKIKKDIKMSFFIYC